MDSIKKAQVSGIPSWQKAQDASPRTTEAEQPESIPDETQPSTIDRAREFLVDSSIRDAPIDQKKAFLKTKGFSIRQIDEAMTLTPGETASPTPPQAKAASSQITSCPPASQSNFDPSSFSSQQASTGAPPQTHSMSQLPPSASSPSPTPSVPSPTQTTSLAPPIITYPERLSLLSHPAPTPLITAVRLTTAAYILGALSATVYGTSRFLVNPMINTLADARRDFAGSALQKVEGLNSSLERVVSQVPSRREQGVKASQLGPKDDEDDSATACFTQTVDVNAHAESAPARTTTLSSTSSTSSTGSNTKASTTTTIADELASITRLRTLTAQQKESTQSEEDATDSIHSSLSDLRGYLFKLEASRYASSGISGISGYRDASLAGEDGIARDKAGAGNGKWGTGVIVDAKKQRVDVDVDEVKEVRKTIGEVKSVLLSARNFPRGGAMVKLSGLRDER